MGIRETGQAHEVLGEALTAQGLFEKAILEFTVAIGLFVDQPEHREGLVEKALEITELMGDAPLAEAIRLAQKMAAAQN